MVFFRITDHCDDRDIFLNQFLKINHQLPATEHFHYAQIQQTSELRDTLISSSSNVTTMSAMAQKVSKSFIKTSMIEANYKVLRWYMYLQN